MPEVKNGQEKNEKLHLKKPPGVVLPINEENMNNCPLLQK